MFLRRVVLGIKIAVFALICCFHLAVIGGKVVFDTMMLSLID